MTEPITPGPRLRPCPDCEHPCSVEAVTCPGCGRPFMPSDVQEEMIYDHVMQQSSMKVGMCLTLLGLIKVVEGAKSVTSFSDEMLAVAAVLFLCSHMVVYSGLKQRNPARKRQMGSLGDKIFFTALLLLASTCGVLVFELL